MSALPRERRLSNSFAPHNRNFSGRYAQAFADRWLMRKPSRTCRVLVVEDDLDQVHSLTYLLRDMGYDVRFAINGYAALAIAQSFHPEVVLLNMGLPDLDGCEIARRLKKQGDPFVRIVAVTARSTDEDRRRSLAAGCEQHLVKPVHPATIGQLIRAR